MRRNFRWSSCGLRHQSYLRGRLPICQACIPCGTLTLPIASSTVERVEYSPTSTTSEGDLMLRASNVSRVEISYSRSRRMFLHTPISYGGFSLLDFLYIDFFKTLSITKIARSLEPCQMFIHSPYGLRDADEY